MVDEKYFISSKMVKYILNIDGAADKTGFCSDNSVLNPTVAHAICVRSTGGAQRCGVENYIAYGFPEDFPVSDMIRIIESGE